LTPLQHCSSRHKNQHWVCVLEPPGFLLSAQKQPRPTRAQRGSDVPWSTPNPTGFQHTLTAWPCRNLHLSANSHGQQAEVRPLLSCQDPAQPRNHSSLCLGRRVLTDSTCWVVSAQHWVTKSPPRFKKFGYPSELYQLQNNSRHRNPQKPLVFLSTEMKSCISTLQIIHCYQHFHFWSSECISFLPLARSHPHSAYVCQCRTKGCLGRREPWEDAGTPKAGKDLSDPSTSRKKKKKEV